MNRSAFCLAVLCVLALRSSASAESFHIKTLAGKVGLADSSNGTNQNAGFHGPAGIGVDGSGNVYIADGNAIRKMTAYGTNWAVTTLAGLVGTHGAVDATGSNARFNFPQGLAVDSQGTIFVADTFNEAIRKVTPDGVVTTIAGLPGPVNVGSADGTNSIARFNNPQGIALASDGSLFVADTYNNLVRQIKRYGSDWVTTTIAGLAGATGTNDGVGTSARFNWPLALIAESPSVLYIADYRNHTIRRLQKSGANWTVSTYAGLGGQSGTNDGPGALARFNRPDGITIDTYGKLLVADGDNHTLRRISGGLVTTVAGKPLTPGFAEGIGSAARFQYPYGLAVDSAGRLFIADNGNFVMRMGTSDAQLSTRIVGNKLEISWPLSASNTVLQTTTTLAPGAVWVTTSGVIVSGSSNVFTKDLTGSGAFYRLIKP